MKRLIPVLALFVVCAGAVAWYAWAEGPCGITDVAVERDCQPDSTAECGGLVVKSPSGAVMGCSPDKITVKTYKIKICDTSTQNERASALADCVNLGYSGMYCRPITIIGIPTGLTTLRGPCYDYTQCVPGILNCENGTTATQSEDIAVTVCCNGVLAVPVGRTE
jgi:hypothetical protein